jgi:hypothetical protein
VQRENGDVVILQRPKVLAARKRLIAAEFAQRFAQEKAKKQAQCLVSVTPG